MPKKAKSIMTRMSFLGAVVAATLVGCHWAGSGPRSGPGGGSSEAIPREPAVTEVLAPEGLGVPASPTRLHVLELGDTPMVGVVAGTGSVLIPDTLLYFTDPADRYYVARTDATASVASLVTTRTDWRGRYQTPAVFVRGMKVVANAFLAQNRRLAGLGTAGGFTDVSAGSTYVIEFFRDQAAHRGLESEDLLAQSAVLDVLADQQARADFLLESGRLPAPTDGPDGDLVIGNGAVLAAKYTLHAIGGDSVASKAWRTVFPGLHALSTFAGNFQLDDKEPLVPTRATAIAMHGPAAVAQGAAPDDAVYVVEREGWLLKKVTPDGNMTMVAGSLQGGDPSVETATVSADGAAFAAASGAAEPTFRLAMIHEVRADAAGNLAVTFQGGPNRFHFVGFLCRTAGTYFGRAMVAGKFYYLAAPDGKEGYQDGALATARFRDPQGLVFDDAGNLYVCDRRHNRIRRIGTDGTVDTVLGDGWPFLTPPATGGTSWTEKTEQQERPDALGGPFSTLTPDEAGATGTASIKVTDFGRLVNQPEASSGRGLKASFNRPLKLAWRKVGNQQELYIYDSYNSCIRKATAPYGGSFKDGSVVTYAGQTKSVPRTSSGSATASFTVTIGDGGAAVDGPVGGARFNFARYDPSTRTGVQVVDGGLALDVARNVLFVTDTNNQAIRAIDLATNTVSTVAKNAPDVFEGDASRVLLSANLGGLALLRDGSLVFADSANHVLRRLHLQFGL